MPFAPKTHSTKRVGKVHTPHTPKTYDKARGSAASRGYDRRWRKAREGFLAKYPICACGCGGLATVVDHIKPHKGDKKLFWDRANWQPMTKVCHDRKTAREDGGFGNERQP